MATDELKQLLGEGAQLFKDGKLDEAIIKLKAAVEADPSSVQAHSYLGAAYASDGQHPASVEQFQAVVDLDPDSPVHNFNLGQAFETAGSRPRAITLYQKALALDPKYARAQQRLDALTGRPVAPAAPAASAPSAPPSAPPQGAPRPMAPPAAAPLGGPPQYGTAPTQYGAAPQYGGQSQSGPQSSFDPSLGLGKKAPDYTDYSPSWKRFVAALIDGAITAVVIVPMVLYQVSTADPTGSASSIPATSGMQIFAALFGLLYYVGFNSFLGATPGKLALGMRILKTDGSKIGFGTALGRYVLMGVLSSITCQLAYIVILVNGDHRGWHDQALDTMVVDKA